MGIHSKIITLDKLALKAVDYHNQGLAVVLCHGTFDLMHPGHIRHLERAAREGDVLFVTLTADEFVNKGPDRPVFPSEVRAESLASLEFVDLVAINAAMTGVNVIKLVKPDVYVKGSEYKELKNDITGNILLEVKATEDNGGKVIFTNEPTHSSTHLLNQYFDVFEPATKTYLQSFKKKYTEKEIIDSINSLGNKKTLVIGDVIIDEYHYASMLGQSGKSNSLVVRYNSEERFAGGAIAVANHLAGFVDDITLLSGLGSKDSHEGFIRSRMEKKIKKQFFYFPSSSTLIKRRYLDEGMAKLFEVYFGGNETPSNEMDTEVCSWLRNNLEYFDIVVVPDFGNGFISPDMVEILCKKAKFLAVNTQINSGNRGFHVITRYERADFVSLNEPEVRLAAHNRHGPLEQIVSKLAEQIHAKQFAVTQGQSGALFFDVEHNQQSHVCALSTKVFDRIGAGDAFFALSALCAGGNLSSEVTAFVGSAAAALDVQIVCNRDYIKPSPLFKYIRTLLK